ncbi:MAG TPA: cell surface protein, partial [Fuerstia sp.]|nr:cell surface protein [Fuerstiella sp.]
MKTLRLSVTLLAVSVLHSAVHAQDAQKPVSITVSPADVSLTNVDDRQSMLVQAVMSNGLTYDVTDKVQLAIENGAFVKLDAHTFYPVADGTTKATVSYEGHSVDLPITVSNAKVELPISFRLDVMPVFMKTSCNNGSCHGAARGKDGFRLSLFGFDPAGDHFRVTREQPGRRINLALPEESLLIEKCTGAVPHNGGKRFDVGDEQYNTLVRWLKTGALDDPKPAEVPTVLAVELYPKTAVLDGDGQTQRLTVRAKYSDGTDRDVTSLAFFSSNNETAAEITQQGIVTAHERGEAFIMARFDTHTVGSHFIVLPKGLTYEDPKTPNQNYIDVLVHNKLRKLRITPSGVCTDEQF